MNKEFVEYLKEKISIVEVVSSRIRLRRVGTVWNALCPFHKEKTGSFHVDESRGIYHCFGCGAAGDAIKFIMEYDKIPFLEAVAVIANLYGIPIPQNKKPVKSDPYAVLFAIMDYTREYFIRALHSDNGLNARSYLNQRKISPEQIKNFELGFAPKTSELYDQLKKQSFSDKDLVRTGIFVKSQYSKGLVNRYQGRLIFPIVDPNNKCVGFGGRIIGNEKTAKYINSPETEIYKKNQQLYGYNLARKSKSRQIIISEGYLDVISLHQAGFDAAVAPLGTAISSTQIYMCWKICNNPIIALDGDSAGVQASYRWIDRILTLLEPGKSFSFAALPQGSDPDLLVYNQQISVIKDAIQKAIPLSQWLWEGGFSLYPSETPEQKAEIIEMLRKKIETIKNTSIKNFYLQDLKTHQNQSYRNKKRVKKKENLNKAIPAKEKIEKILVATIINHPYIMDRVLEDFVKLEFENTTMRLLKEKILKIYTNFASVDSQKFQETMLQLVGTVEGNFEDVKVHASFIDKSVEDSVALNGWMELLKKYLSEPLLDKDLKAISNNFSFSETNWQRLKALKNEILGRKIK